MNVARNGFGKAPTVESCSEGVWRQSIDESGLEHETYVILDDRDHKKGNLYKFLVSPVENGPPPFPIVFVFDHNGRMILEDFRDPGLSVVEDAVIEQEKVYDKELKKALASKGKDAGGDSSKQDEEDDKSSEKKEESE